MLLIDVPFHAGGGGLGCPAKGKEAMLRLRTQTMRHEKPMRQRGKSKLSVSPSFFVAMSQTFGFRTMRRRITNKVYQKIVDGERQDFRNRKHEASRGLSLICSSVRALIIFREVKACVDFAANKNFVPLCLLYISVRSQQRSPVSCS